jgi:DNA-binding NarL/FixJ family response regulator
VLIVDDHPAVRDALAAEISRHHDLTVCGEAADLADALKLLESEEPDIAIIDISLKTGNGIDLIKRIRDRDLRVRMLVWSMYDESLYAERALRAGAMGYINKQHATDRIIEAIRQVLRGRIFVSEQVMEKLLGRVTGRPADPQQSPVDSLSDRELQVFELIGRGLTTADTAARLRLSVSTIETHRFRIREKLGLTNAAELAREAAQWVLENG